MLRESNEEDQSYNRASLGFQLFFTDENSFNTKMVLISKWSKYLRQHGVNQEQKAAGRRYMHIVVSFFDLTLERFFALP